MDPEPLPSSDDESSVPEGSGASRVQPLQFSVLQFTWLTQVSTKSTRLRYCTQPAGAPLEWATVRKGRPRESALAEHHSGLPTMDPEPSPSAGGTVRNQP